MAKYCSILSIKSKTNRTKDSILYSTIRENLRDDALAFNLYEMSKSSKYNSLRKNPDNLDENGELTYEAFYKYIYLPDYLGINTTNALDVAIAEMKVMMRKRIAILEKMISPESTIESSRKKRFQVELETLMRDLESPELDELEFVLSFVDQLYNLVKESSVILNEITQPGREFNQEDVKNLVDIRNEFASFGVFKSIEKVMNDPVFGPMLKNLERLNWEKNESGSINTEEVFFADKIAYILKEKSNAEEKLVERGFPLMADWLLKYNPKTINASVMALIANVRTHKRGKYIVEHDEEYKALKRKLKEGKILQEQFNEEVTELAIRQIENRNLITRKSLIENLKRVHRDRSGFSYLLDPSIYTNDQITGLFARALKQEEYDAAMKTRETAYLLTPIYEEFVRESGRGTFNAAKLNEELLEEIEVYSHAHGKIIKRLSLVQELDITRFNNNLRTFNEGLHEKILEVLKNKRLDYSGIPKGLKREQLYQWFESEEGKAWKEKQTLKNPVWTEYQKTRSRLVAKWFQENTEATPGAMEKIARIEEEMNQLQKRINQLQSLQKDRPLTHEETAKLNRTFTILKDHKNWLNKNTIYQGFDNGRVPKGKLAKPKVAIYENEKYKKLKKDPILFKYYTAMLDQYKKDQKNLSKSHLDTNPWEDFTYFMPSTPKDNKDFYIESNGHLGNAIKRDWQDAITITDTDTQFGITNEMGEPLKTVPVFFTNAAESDVVSRDIFSSILQFHHMTNQYIAKSNIHANVILLQDLINRREVPRSDGYGNPIIDALAKKNNKDEYSLKPQGDANSTKALRDFIDLAFYGIKEEKSMVGNINLNKLASKITKWTGMNMLALNFLQGINNATFGNLMFLTESIGKQYFDHKNWLRAHRLFYFENYAGIPDLQQINAKTKMGKMIEIFDPQQGGVIDDFGNNLTGPRLKKAFNSDALFFLQHGGEFEMQTKTMLALLDSLRVVDKNGQLLKNKNGSEMSLYDAYVIDPKTGKLLLNSEVEGIVYGKENKDITLSVADVRAIIHGLNGKMHGKYNEFDRNMLQRQWYGKLAMLFRGWVIPGFRRRWGMRRGTPQVDFETGMTTEGIYVSFIRFLKESIDNHYAFKKTFSQMSEMEKAGTIKTISELVMLSTAFVLLKGLTALGDDDDDREGKAFYFTLYQLRRLQSDMLFYVNPAETWKIVKSPSAAISYFAKANKFLFQLLLDPLETYQRDSGLAEKGDLKLWWRIKEMAPVIAGIEKSLTPEESYQWFKSWKPY